MRQKPLYLSDFRDDGVLQYVIDRVTRSIVDARRRTSANAAPGR
jgi:ethanolamine ammonia-lyase large subunit